MDNLTISEQEFEEFCRLNRIRFRRIPTDSDSGLKTPDYEIDLDGVTIVIEIKQLDPNPDDERAYQELVDEGSAFRNLGEPGKRIRSKITQAYNQLKNHSMGIKPTCLILYSNVAIDGYFIDPYEIKSAMFGLEQLILGVPESPAQKPFLIDRIAGPKKKVSDKYNKSLSCIGVLRKNNNEEITLSLFHNPFASIKLPDKLLRQKSIRHFRISQKEQKSFQEWEEF